MFTGFLCAPALLSISMILYGVNGLWGIHPSRWFRNTYWIAGVAWVAFYALTWFWSADKEYWSIGLQVKLPFLILPLAFGFTPRFTTRQMQIFTVAAGLFFLAGAGYSLSFLIREPDKYLFGYRISHLLPTPSRNDHICFSLAITLYIVWCVYCWPWLQSTAVKWITGILMTILVLFIHILAAKSGIISFYLFLALWGFYLAFSKRKIIGLIVLVTIPLFIVFAMKYIPTFRDRAAYIYYSFVMAEAKDRTGNYGDIGRIWSQTIGWKLIKEHPFSGVGAGDMMVEMKKGYDRWHPEVVEENRLIPHNQFLIVALCSGIPAMLIFAIWAFMPLAWLRKNRESFFMFTVWLILMFYLVIDTGLEVQMGVFVFTVFILLFKQQLPERVQNES